MLNLNVQSFKEHRKKREEESDILPETLPKKYVNVQQRYHMKSAKRLSFLHRIFSNCTLDIGADQLSPIRNELTSKYHLFSPNKAPNKLIKTSNICTHRHWAFTQLRAVAAPTSCYMPPNLPLLRPHPQNLHPQSGGRPQNVSIIQDFTHKCTELIWNVQKSTGRMFNLQVNRMDHPSFYLTTFQK